MSDDTRSMADLAAEAIRVQDACNLSGVVHAFSRSLTRLRRLLEESGGASSQAVNRHPIAVMWSSKVASLTGSESMTEFGRAYQACQDLARVEKAG